MQRFIKKLLLLVILIFSISCKVKQNDELYLNYIAAINNGSTFQYHLVIKLKNLNTGEIREVCTEGNFLQGALHREYDLAYDEEGVEKAIKLAIENKKRYYEFKNDSAIINIGSEDYTMKELEKLEKKINFDSLATQIKAKKKWAIALDNKEMMMYAHALFNRGVLTGENNCMGGRLYYIDRDNPPF
ncbi:hypothetical protein MH928_16045 [Flavobacterium sp. WW92]|uniref:hypothetical protein n=1 Tax=unclassified Flavobacterium TaxID=196869 RepID=UPI0022243D26|nr:MULTISPECIES: hypothetical protein [unclassified Flavobacterium]WDO12822.1 hypothetical protein MH928_16045 [Flavobacterium sp. WW92]